MLVTIPDPTLPNANGTTIIRIAMDFGRRALPQVCTVAAVSASRRAAATAFGLRRTRLGAVRSGEGLRVEACVRDFPHQPQQHLR